MGELKIAFITHQLFNTKPGGAETQIIKNKEYLDKLGVKIQLFDMWHDIINDYDIIHIFNPHLLPSESLSIANECKKNNVKVCVSPIFWISPYESFNRNHIYFDLYVNSLKIPILNRITSSFGAHNYTKNLFDICDMILPNTQAELKLLKSFYRISHKRFSVIPNGVDKRFKDGKPHIFSDKVGFDDFILYVGGIYPRKNVLSLIRAFNKSKIDTNLVIMGRVHDPDYFSACTRESRDNITFLPPIAHNSEMLKSAYKSAKVVTLPSYYETPGLSCLEGGLAGANIVITEVGGTKEYFRDHVRYINPENENSIAKALISAYNDPKNNELSYHIENNFSWERVADKLLETYLKL